MALPDYTTTPRDRHRKPSPHCEHPGEALAEGAGGMPRTRAVVKHVEVLKELGFTLRTSSVPPRGHNRDSLTMVPQLSLEKTKLDQKLLLGKFWSGPELSRTVPAAIPCCASLPSPAASPTTAHRDAKSNELPWVNPHGIATRAAGPAAGTQPPSLCSWAVGAPGCAADGVMA